MILLLLHSAVRGLSLKWEMSRDVASIVLNSALQLAWAIYIAIYIYTRTHAHIYRRGLSSTTGIRIDKILMITPPF